MDALVLSDFTTKLDVQALGEKSVAKERKKIIVSSSIKLLLTFMVGLIAWTSWKPTLYDQYKIDKRIIVEQLAKNANKDFKTAAAYVENDDYYGARRVISKYYLGNSENAKLAIQYAILLIAGDCFETSKQVLYPLYYNKNEEVKTEAAYLLGLTFLKEGNNQGSIQWFSKVSVGSVYHRQATELIKKIELSKKV